MALEITKGTLTLTMSPPVWFMAPLSNAPPYVQMSSQHSSGLSAPLAFTRCADYIITSNYSIEGSALPCEFKDYSR